MAQPQGRVGDNSFVPVDTHGKLCCPHSATGPATVGSPNVFVEGKPALMVGSTGIHAKCCGPNTWVAMKGSPVVKINNEGAFRRFDLAQHCGGKGYLVQGSPTVIVGDCTETTLANAQTFAQALVPVNLEVVPVQPVNVEVIPGPTTGTAVDPGDGQLA